MVMCNSYMSYNVDGIGGREGGREGKVTNWMQRVGGVGEEKCLREGRVGTFCIDQLVHKSL